MRVVAVLMSLVFLSLSAYAETVASTLVKATFAPWTWQPQAPDWLPPLDSGHLGLLRITEMQGTWTTRQLLSPDGKDGPVILRLSEYPERIELLNLKDQSHHFIQHQIDRSHHLIAAPDATWLASAADEPRSPGDEKRNRNSPGVVWLHDLTKPERIAQELKLGNTFIKSLRNTPDGAGLIASGDLSVDGHPCAVVRVAIKVQTFAGMDCLLPKAPGLVRAAFLAKDGSELFVMVNDEKLLAYDVKSLKTLRTLPLTRSREFYPLPIPYLSATGRYLIAPMLDDLCLYRTPDFSKVSCIDRTVSEVEFCPDDSCTVEAHSDPDPAKRGVFAMSIEPERRPIFHWPAAMSWHVLGVLATPPLIVGWTQDAHYGALGYPLIK